MAVGPDLAHISYRPPRRDDEHGKAANVRTFADDGPNSLMQSPSPDTGLRRQPEPSQARSRPVTGRKISEIAAVEKGWRRAFEGQIMAYGMSFMAGRPKAALQLGPAVH
jgi:hypothetical protein